MNQISVDNPKKYNTLNGLRAIACIAIIMMHMAANNDYHIVGYWYNTVIPSFTDFVFLFMVLSAFGMCCGYLDAIQKGNITPLSFYKRRYLKILPFFALLVILDLILNYQDGSIPEAFADLTLLYGLFPNQISVIGVGWFLGLVFAFYLIFPFYSVLMTSKKMAWGAFAISIALNYFGETYFGLERQNIVYSLCYFMLGGLIYLYRDEIKRIPQGIGVMGVLVTITIYYWWGANTTTRIFVSAFFVVVAIGLCDTNAAKLLDNTVLNFLGSISLELYLSNMLVFRAMEKAGVNSVMRDDILQYFATVLVSLGGTVLFVIISKKILEILFKCIVRVCEIEKQGIKN